ncbi:MAG: hypothetical protein AB7T49_02850 [Oligoflexales bacterium]
MGQKGASGHLNAASIANANRGDVVFCEASANANSFEGYYSLDYFATGAANIPKIVEVETWEKSMSRILGELSEKLPLFETSFQNFLKSYAQTASSEHTNLWRAVSKITDMDGGLVGVSNADLEITLPGNCVVRKAESENVIQSVIRSYDNGTIKYTYDKDILSALANAKPLQFSFLMVHTWLKDFSGDIKVIREANKILHSSDLEALSPQDLRAALGGLGLPLIDCNAGIRNCPEGNILVRSSRKYGYGCTLAKSKVRCWKYSGSSEAIDPSVFEPPKMVNPRILATGENYNCAYDEDPTGPAIRCWGDREQSQIPDTITEVTNPTGIALGETHACAIHDEGVSCWGSTSAREKGLLTPPSGIQGARLITASDTDTCVVDSLGIMCWGLHLQGRLVFGMNPALVLKLVVNNDGNICSVLQINGPFGPEYRARCNWPYPEVFEELSDMGGIYDVALDTNMACVVSRYGNVAQCSTKDQNRIKLDGLENPSSITIAGSGICALDDKGVHCWKKYADQWEQIGFDH